MSGASQRANGRASGPVLTSLFLFVPDHSARVVDVVSSLDLWMSNDADWIRSLMRERLESETKNLLKENPKKNARAVMTIIGVTIKASGLKANPLLVKSIVEEEVRKLKSSRA